MPRKSYNTVFYRGTCYGETRNVTASYTESLGRCTKFNGGHLAFIFEDDLIDAIAENSPNRDLVAMQARIVHVVQKVGPFHLYYSF